MLSSLRWSFTFLTSVVLVMLGFRKQFADVTQLVPSWKGDSEDLTPHGVYSAASLCDAFGICLTCSAVAPRSQNSQKAEVSHSFEGSYTFSSQ